MTLAPLKPRQHYFSPPTGDAEITVMLLASPKVTAFPHKHDRRCSLTSNKGDVSTQAAALPRPNRRAFRATKRTTSAATCKCWCHDIWFCLDRLIHHLIPRNVTESGFIHRQFQLNRVGTVLSDEYDTQAREDKTEGKVLTMEPLILASIRCTD